MSFRLVQTRQLWTSQVRLAAATVVAVPSNVLQPRRISSKDANTSTRITRNILVNSKIQEYLDHVAATKRDVTLADVERCRPHSHSPPGSPEYAAEYLKLCDTLALSFSKKQLVEFVGLYGFRLPKSKTKFDYALTIIEKQWNWPSLSEIQKKQRDWSEVSRRTFPLDVCQSFLMLGKDGVDLLDLSMKYQVHVSFSSQPLALHVEGLIGHLKELSQHISKIKNEIVHEMVDIPAQRPLRPELAQRISRISGAFVQEISPGKIQISHKTIDKRAFLIARRLAIRAACGVQEGYQQTSLFSYHSTPSGTHSSIPMSLVPQTYSLFPFFSPRPLPWISNNAGLFRLRRVAEWPHQRNLAERALSFDEETVRDETGNGQELRQLLSSSSNTIISASLGHILFSSLNPPLPSILPPLAGSWPLSKVLQWVAEHQPRRFFLPSLSPVLLESPPRTQQLLHRLVYRAMEPNLNAKGLVSAKTLKLETSFSYSPNSPLQLERSSSSNALPNFRFICQSGSETRLDLVIPHRAMDIQFASFDARSLTESQWPGDLRQYGRDLQAFLHYKDSEAAQPDAPLLLPFQGDTYVLESSSSIRQNVDVMPDFEAVSESTLDLEGNQKTALSQVICKDIFSDTDWDRFIKGCDRLSNMPSSSVVADLEIPT